MKKIEVGDIVFVAGKGIDEDFIRSNNLKYSIQKVIKVTGSTYVLSSSGFSCFGNHLIIIGINKKK